MPRSSKTASQELLARARVALMQGRDAGQAAAELREQPRTSPRAARWVTAQAEADLLADKAPKGLVEEAAAVRHLEYQEAAAQKLVGRHTVSLARSVATSVAWDRAFLREFGEVAVKTLGGKLQIKPYRPRASAPCDRAVNLVLSDLHFQSLLDPTEVPVQYGPREEARRFAWVVRQAADYKPQYRDQSELHVHLIGDLMQGLLGHDPRDGAPLTSQFCATLHYLMQAAAFWSTCFRRVKLRCLPGNHGRNIARHPGRAIHQKWDSIETMVYHALRAAVAHIPNVEVELFQTPHYVWEAFGSFGFATHGDTVFNTGQPSRSIDVRSLEVQIHKINAARQQANQPRISLFVGGHVHSLNTHLASTGEWVLTNGCLVPPDPYAISHGEFGLTCAQALFESVEGHIFGDFRGILVGPKQDRDASLEDVIRPYEGFGG